MTSKQLLLDLPIRTARGRDDFFVAPSNELAVKKIDDYQNWAGRKLVLAGPKGSGKSHLVGVWSDLTHAQIVEADKCKDALQEGPMAVENVDLILGDRELEEALFHLHNCVLSQGHPFLMTVSELPERLDFSLPDLKSRVLAADLVRLGEPDDALLAVVLVKLFADRQLHVEPDVIKFLITRIDRSFADAERVVAMLDEASMMQRKPITVRFAGGLLKSQS